MAASGRIEHVASAHHSTLPVVIAIVLSGCGAPSEGVLRGVTVATPRAGRYTVTLHTGHNQHHNGVTELWHARARLRLDLAPNGDAALHRVRRGVALSTAITSRPEHPINQVRTCIDERVRMQGRYETDGRRVTVRLYAEENLADHWRLSCTEIRPARDGGPAGLLDGALLACAVGPLGPEFKPPPTMRGYLVRHQQLPGFRIFLRAQPGLHVVWPVRDPHRARFSRIDEQDDAPELSDGTSCHE